MAILFPQCTSIIVLVQVNDAFSKISYNNAQLNLRTTTQTQRKEEGRSSNLRWSVALITKSADRKLIIYPIPFIIQTKFRVGGYIVDVMRSVSSAAQPEKKHVVCSNIYQWDLFQEFLPNWKFLSPSSTRIGDGLLQFNLSSFVRYHFPELGRFIFPADFKNGQERERILLTTSFREFLLYKLIRVWQ